MGNEREVDKKVTLSKAVLAALGIGGLLVVAAVAPNTLQLLRYLPSFNKKFAHKKARLPYEINAAVSRLRKEGYIEIKERNGKAFVQLTEKGRRRFRRYKLQALVSQKPPKWDGKWRIVIFDVRENRRSARNRLRDELRNFGFVRLQNSVWVYPYDSEELISLLKTDGRLWNSVLYIVAEKLEGEERLKKAFNLS